MNKPNNKPKVECWGCPTPIESSKGDWKERFRELFQPQGTKIKYVNVNNFVVVEAIETFIADLLSSHAREIREKQEIQIGMLRQWLNEDRIKDADRFVTNEQIKYWLDLAKKP